MSRILQICKGATRLVFFFLWTHLGFKCQAFLFLFFLSHFLCVLSDLGCQNMVEKGGEGPRDEQRSGRTDGWRCVGRVGRGERKGPPSSPATRPAVREHAVASVRARMSSNLNVFQRELNNLFLACNLCFVAQCFALLLRPHHLSLGIVRPVEFHLQLSLGV